MGGQGGIGEWLLRVDGPSEAGAEMSPVEEEAWRRSAGVDDAPRDPGLGAG